MNKKEVDKWEKLYEKVFNLFIIFIFFPWYVFMIIRFLLNF